MKQTLSGCALALVALSVTADLTAQQPTCTPTPPQVMCGLDNPRGLAFGPEGTLYVVEAGRGGGVDEAQKPLGQPCKIDNTGKVIRWCGRTGAVSRLRGGVQEKFATGFPSAIDANRIAQAGPADISFLGSGYVTIGLRD